MTAAYTSVPASSRLPCTFCASRHKGLCQSVDERDVDSVAALNAVHSAVRVYDAGDVVYAQGDASEHVFNLISGWVALHRDMADGRRQITRFLQPGALFGIAPAGEEHSHTATTITTTTVCPIKTTKFNDLRRGIGSLNEQFIAMLERDRHATAKTLTTLGQGNAKERIGSLLAELAAIAVGEGAIRTGVVLKLPLTQRHIGEATGLTSIHVNRVLRQLREEGVVELRDGKLIVIDAGKLQALGHPGVGSPRADSWADRRLPPLDRGLAVRALPRSQQEALHR